MKKLFILIPLLVSLIHNKAKCDNIIIGGDTFSMIFFSPFDNYPGSVKLREQLKDYRTNCTEDNCLFLSTWKIMDNRLVLTKIENCECNDKKQTANLKSLFGNAVKKGVLCADWYTGEIWVTKDQPNSWGGMFAASWPRETRLIVENGIVTSVKNFVYPKPVETVYYKNADSLNKFIYTHLNWVKFQNLPPQGNRCYLRFGQDENGYLINIKLEVYGPPHLPLDKDEIAEISRVMGLLQWPAYYYHNKPVKNLTGMVITLNKEMQDKYAN